MPRRYGGVSASYEDEPEKSSSGSQRGHEPTKMGGDPGKGMAGGGYFSELEHFGTDKVHEAMGDHTLNHAIGRNFMKVDAGRGPVDEHYGYPHDYGDHSLKANHEDRAESKQDPWTTIDSPMGMPKGHTGAMGKLRG